MLPIRQREAGRRRVRPPRATPPDGLVEGASDDRRQMSRSVANRL
jgi:hypothetical protein